MRSAWERPIGGGNGNGNGRSPQHSRPVAYNSGEQRGCYHAAFAGMNQITRRTCLLFSTLPFLAKGQGKKLIEQEIAEKVEFVCPMDADVKSPQPGTCPRCHMKLVANLPDPIEYPVELESSPALVKPGGKTELRIKVRDPKTGKIQQKFEIMHEKLMHFFAVSEDLSYFLHEHPQIQSDGSFLLPVSLPEGGMYRLLVDFYPTSGTPQLAVKTLFAEGASPGPHLEPQLAPQKAANLTASLKMQPEQPLAGQKSILFFDLSPGEGLEPYLGAWGHMLCASEDLIDLMHLHPMYASGEPRVQFNAIFPRAGMYRIWTQFQRQGQVNTVAFTIPVKEL